ncbi:dipeptidase [Bosea psychrotolerans]|uniref:Acetylornithine deacetylase/succinyl-diaminopimelate desuccinylase-like protein n=1 Tax=Bosea psychrotolerans TaxID=1871628 RepID=A0A2S4M328_9HYPH|nr:dipeptidase [Bosea psychrotolerans]POR48989.1 acetylornithine deacetylase/succinyl-diaminopimelate desuccinylase-like protein [Bosea psychrotolerans]
MSKLPAVLSRLDADLDASLARLSSWLEIPSISTDSAYWPDSRRAAEWLRADLESLGFKASLGETPGQPVVLAHRPKPGAPHVLFYGHYDVQPVDPLNLWDTEPFKPVVKEIAPGRKVIVARGACDDKGQVMTFVEAMRATIAETGDLPVGVTILVEGEEESGSVNLPAFVRENAEALKADIALVCDTGMWDRDTPAITASLRGMVYQEVTIKCADRDLHSGLFGGAAANPVHVLSRIIASLHDETGRITVPGFYEGVEEPSNSQKADWADLGLTEEEFLGQIGLKHSIGEKGRMLIEQIQSRPTCDVNGIWGGYTGEGTKTVIAAKASAKVSFRLVGKQDPDKIAAAFQAYVRAQLPDDISAEFIVYSASPAIAVPADSPALTKARAALTEEWGRKAVTIGSGGSVPVVGDFKRLLGMDTLLVGFGLDDDRVHSPNEKYDLSSFHKGQRSWARILQALGS